MVTLEDLEIAPSGAVLDLAYSDKLTYKGHFRSTAQCHLDLYDGPGLRVAIATEMAYNTGLSITNGIKNVAFAVEALFDLPHVFGKTPADKPSVLIEHYGDMSYEYGRFGREDYSVVKFGIEKGSFNYYGEPDWIRIDKSEVERLIGRPL